MSRCVEFMLQCLLTKKDKFCFFMNMDERALGRKTFPGNSQGNRKKTYYFGLECRVRFLSIELNCGIYEGLSSET